MGESWSDLDALEYLHEYGYVPTDGDNDWARGPVRDRQQAGRHPQLRAQRQPAQLQRHRLRLAEAPEVHADGEIWNAVNYDIRQALVTKYNGRFPSTDTALQLRCANGELPATSARATGAGSSSSTTPACSMPPATSMLDARDAMLAADVMRFGGANQTAIWHAFASARHGPVGPDRDHGRRRAEPGFDSPHADNATVTFSGVKSNGRERPTRSSTSGASRLA